MFNPHDHTLYILTTPRQSMRCYWSCVELYDALQMTTYGGKRSKWLTESKESWQDTFSKIGVDKRNYMSSMREDTSFTSDVDNASLPTSSVSTLGLFISLSRWAHFSTSHGGLKKAISRGAACEFFGWCDTQLALAVYAHSYLGEFYLEDHVAMQTTECCRLCIADLQWW